MKNLKEIEKLWTEISTGISTFKFENPKLKIGKSEINLKFKVYA